MINPAYPDFLNTPVSSVRPCYKYALIDCATPPVVTITTPFYNVSPELFQETAQSVLQQSFQQWEWLIINDGSTDLESLSILAQYRHQDPRIRVIDHSQNRGLSAARNTGFLEAQTEFVVLLDGDDLLEPTAIEKWFWFLATQPQYMFVHGYSVGFGSQQYLWSCGFDQNENNLIENQIDHTSMVRGQVWHTVGGFDETNRAGLEDWEFWVHCAAQGLWGTTIPEYLSWYRRRDNHSDVWSNLTQHGTTIFRQYLQGKYSQLYAGHFPTPYPRKLMSYSSIPVALPCQNLLVKSQSTQRILFLIPWLEIGGADKFNLDLVEQLVQRHYEVTICTTVPGSHPWLANMARFTPDIFNLPNFLELTDYPRFLLYLVQSRQIDTIFISNSYLGYQLLPFLRAYCPQVILVDYLHSRTPGQTWKNGGYPRISAGYHQLLDLTITSHSKLKAEMVELGCNADRLEVCYTNIDPDSWNPAHFDPNRLRQQLDLSPQKPILLYVGRVATEKRPLLLAEVVRRLATEARLDFTCLVAGDGPELPALREFARRHALDPWFNFIGTVTPEQMPDFYALADIFLLPSEYEGISLALYEAMSMETVPVVADVGGQSELVTPECGYLIPHGENEIEDYVRILKHLITSPAQRQKMAQAGRERIVTHFRLEQMAEQVVKLLNKAQHLAQTEPRPGVSQGLGLECATLAIEYTRLEQEAERHWQRIHELAANEQQLRQQLEQLQQTLNQQPTEAETLNRLSGEDIAHRIPFKKIIKAVGFKLAKQPGVRWLYRYRGLGKKLAGG